MSPLISVVILALLIGGGTAYYVRYRKTAQGRDLDDSAAEARRWVERLGGQVLSLVGTNEPSTQALADAAERYTAASSQLSSAHTAAQCRLVTHTAWEGLYYVRAARVAMGIDPGPDLPPVPGQGGAGTVTEDRDVHVEGHGYAASPYPSDRTPHYYPGGQIAGRPVPQGWYSEPWWKPALIGGAWGLGSALVFSSLFHGMGGIASADAWGQGYAAGQDNALAGAGDWGDNNYADNNYYADSDFGGGDWDSGGDWGGGDF